jgi:hypothetical protein
MSKNQEKYKVNTQEAENIINDVNSFLINKEELIEIVYCTENRTNFEELLLIE